MNKILRTAFVAAGAMRLVMGTATSGWALPATSSPAPSTTSAAPEPLVWLKLSAYSGEPGWKVSVAAACDQPDASPLTSEALRVTSPLARNAEGHQPWALFAETVIAEVPPGSYPVSFHCGGNPVEQHFTVLARKSPPQVSKVPTGPVDTGGGWTAAGR